MIGSSSIIPRRAISRQCKLLVRHDVDISSSSSPVTFGWASDGADSFVKQKQIFYQKTDGAQVKQLKKNNKNLRMLFSDKYDEISDYMNDEKINVNNELELIKVFNYYNSLN